MLLERGTEVPVGWLDALRSVAQSRRDVATVVPLSEPQGGGGRELPGGGAE